MNSLETKIEKLSATLNSVSAELESFDKDNFDKKIERLNFLKEWIEKQRSELISEYNREELKTYNIELDKQIKQIHEKFDNIIESNKKTQKDVSVRLNNLLNNKKLANYQR
jgi:transcriptional regulator of heat shock response